MAGVLWLCMTQKRAQERRKEFCSPKGMHFLSVDGALTGHAFNLIVLDNIDPQKLPISIESWREWRGMFLPTKLLPGGKIIKYDVGAS